MIRKLAISRLRFHYKYYTIHILNLGKQQEVHSYLKLAFKDNATRGEASFLFGEIYTLIKKDKDAVKFFLKL